jgi:phage-related protein
LGFVVSFLLEVLLTGGTAAVKEIIALLGRGASRVTRGIKDIGKQTVKLFDNIHKLLNKAYKAITKNAKKFFEDFKQWLDELVEAIQKFFKFGDVILRISLVLK